MDLNRFINRHHLAAALLAVVVSLVLHALLLARIDHFPLQSLNIPEPVRFNPIEMVDVQPEPPPPEEVIPRQPLEGPSDVAIAVEEAGGIWTDLTPPEPPAQPGLDAIPAPPPPPAQVGLWPDAVARQEVIAIPEPLVGEEVSALPRTWVEEDIPRIDRAPDIQLPVEISEDASTPGSFDAASVASWREGHVAGTPDWISVMGGRNTGVRGTALPGTPRVAVTPLDGLNERPDEISQLQAIESLLQVKVEGYRADDGHFYFALQVERAAEESLPEQPRDILFIQDSSASMTAQKLDECRRGLKRWLDFLNPEDRFEVMGFSDDVSPCFGEWRPYNAANRARAFEFINKLRAAGNTDVFRSMQSALALPQDPARTRLFVLVTDGRPTVGVMGSSEIIEGITRINQGRISIFSVGGGKTVNSFLLDLLSYRNRGEAVVMKGDEEIPRGMEEWARQLQRPVLTDLTYSFSKIDPSDIYPKQLTHLYLDRPLVIHGRIPDGEDPLVFQVVGRSGVSWHDFIFVIERAQVAAGGEGLRRRWAWQKIYHLIGDYLGDASPEKMETIHDFADEHGLIVPYGFSRAMPRR